MTHWPNLVKGLFSFDIEEAMEKQYKTFLEEKGRFERNISIGISFQLAWFQARRLV